MAGTTSLYATATATPFEQNILNVIRVKNNQVYLYWENYVGPVGTFVITRKASRKAGNYEVRGITRDLMFVDTIPAGEWFKYRLEFIQD